MLALLRLEAGREVEEAPRSRARVKSRSVRNDRPNRSTPRWTAIAGLRGGAAAGRGPDAPCRRPGRRRPSVAPGRPAVSWPPGPLRDGTGRTARRGSAERRPSGRPPMPAAARTSCSATASSISLDRGVRQPARPLRDARAVHEPVGIVHEDALREAEVDVLELRADPGEERRRGGLIGQVVADEPPAGPDSLDRLRASCARTIAAEALGDRAHAAARIALEERLDGTRAPYGRRCAVARRDARACGRLARYAERPFDPWGCVVSTGSGCRWTRAEVPSGLVKPAAKRSTCQQAVDSRPRGLGRKVSVEAASASRAVEASCSGAADRTSVA